MLTALVVDSTRSG